MAEAKRITIVGGGLAGLTLGIGLRRHDVPATVVEAGEYPRHRVCGEFISGRGLATLERMGQQEQLVLAGAVHARTAAFCSATKVTATRALPSSAICISRFALDAALASEFRAQGGELILGARRSEGELGEGMVRATGRLLNRQHVGERWLGLKIHTRNVSLAADLEMHVSSRGYVGLCRLQGDEINVCGLFRNRLNRDGRMENPVAWLRGPAGSPLRERLAGAEFDEKSFCAVAGLSLRPGRAAARGEICLGDAITMIPPVTGNGMSMAFESAELATAPLAAWSRGMLSWAQARQQIARDCDAAFRRRLTWAKWLQGLILTPSLQNFLLSFAARSDWFWRTAFDRTR